MNVETIVSAVGQHPAAAVAGRLLKAVRADWDHKYVLTSDVVFRGVRTDHFDAFDYEDDTLCFKTREDGAFDLTLKEGGDCYDGTTMLPDSGGKVLHALLLSSFAHDAIYDRAEAISRATGIPPKQLLAFADDLLKLQAEHHGAPRVVTRPIHGILRSCGRIYHRIRTWLTMILVAALATMSAGCYAVRTTVEEFPDAVEYDGPLPR